MFILRRSIILNDYCKFFSKKCLLIYVKLTLNCTKFFKKKLHMKEFAL